MTDLRVIEQRLNAVERDVTFLAQMVGVVIVDQASRTDVKRLAELGSRNTPYDREESDKPDEPEDDLSTPARSA